MSCLSLISCLVAGVGRVCAEEHAIRSPGAEESSKAKMESRIDDEHQRKMIELPEDLLDRISHFHTASISNIQTASQFQTENSDASHMQSTTPSDKCFYNLYDEDDIPDLRIIRAPFISANYRPRNPDYTNLLYYWSLEESPAVCLSDVLEPPTMKPTIDTSGIADMEQCRGPPLNQQELCRQGSGCVFQSLTRSICLPGFEAISADCSLERFAQCGGQGYAGCQNCPSGTTCAKENSLRYSCIPDDFQPPQPVVEDSGLLLAYRFVQGLDPELDELLDGVSAIDSNTNPELVEAIRARLSVVYATDAALTIFRQLLSTDSTFQQFNSESREELQEQLCSDLQSVQASTEVKSCICRTTSDPFVYCTARLEQELNQFAARRIRERRLTEKQETLYDNLSSDIAQSSLQQQSDKSNGVRSLQDRCSPDIVTQLENLKKTLLGEMGVCQGVECAFPIPAFPAVSLDFEAEYCSPKTADLVDTILNFNNVQQRRDTASAVSVSLEAGLCVTTSGIGDAVATFLEFLNVDLCFLKVEGSIQPVLGLLEGSVRAGPDLGIASLFARGNIVFMFSDELRNTLNLCPSDLQCTPEDNPDCSLCTGNINFEVIVGMRFLFFARTYTIVKSDPPDSCVVYDDNGACQFLTEAPSGAPTSQPSTLAPTVTPGNPTLGPTTLPPTAQTCVPSGAACTPLGTCEICCSGRAFIFICL